jgi:hypothetical protein
MACPSANCASVDARDTLLKMSGYFYELVSKFTILNNRIKEQNVYNQLTHHDSFTEIAVSAHAQVAGIK